MVIELQGVPKMNRKQLLIIWVAIAVIGIMFLCPPWQYHLNLGSSIEIYVEGPYRFVFLGRPDVPVDSDQDSFHEYPRGDWSTELDWGRLILPVAAVIVVLVGLIITFYKRKASSGTP